jgi:hypothetical protein
VSLGRACLLLLAAGCTVGNAPADLPELDREYFDRAVHPVLARSCAFPDCHGTPRRFFSVFARDRHRVVLPDGTGPSISAEIWRIELDLSYEHARGFVDPERPARSLLLAKPLATSAGGLYHRAADQYGAELDVFSDVNDPDYAVLARWVTDGGSCDEAGCEVPAEEVPR